MQRKEAQLEEKREQILQAKGEVDRVMGELTDARRTISTLRSQFASATVRLLTHTCAVYVSLPPSGRAAAKSHTADRSGEPSQPLSHVGVM